MGALDAAPGALGAGAAGGIEIAAEGRALDKAAGAGRHRVGLVCRGGAGRDIGDDGELILGRLAAMPEALSAMAWRAAGLLDSGRGDIEEALSSLAAAARQTGKYVEREVEAFIDKIGRAPV